MRRKRKTAVQRWREKHAEWMAERKTLQERAWVLTEDVDRQKRAIVELEASGATLKMSVSRLEDTIRTLTDRNDAVEHGAALERHHIADLNREVQVVKSECQGLRSTVRMHEDKAVALRAVFASIDATFEQVQSHLDGGPKRAPGWAETFGGVDPEPETYAQRSGGVGGEWATRGGNTIDPAFFQSLPDDRQNALLAEVLRWEKGKNAGKGAAP